MGSPIALQELLKSGFEEFIVPTLEVAPYTSIINRAKVSASLKAIAGKERIMIRSICKLAEEFGPSGEMVWESEDRDSRIRFVGSKWAMLDDIYGIKPWTTNSGEFLEVTFWGTGLNLLTNLDNNASRDWRVTVDNGTEGSNIYLSNYSATLGAKYWNANQSITVSNNLTLGWHTVRVKCYNTGGFGVFGFEILNERSDLAVYSGSAISKGNLIGTSSILTSSFKEGVTGIRGARVVKYIQNGALKSAVQEVNSSTQTYASADHTNEDSRRYYWREFGAGNTNDFSLFNTTGTSRAFTMEDGTTLTGTSIGGYSDGGYEMLGYSSISGYITIDFEGTGLDLITYSNSTNSFTVFIDGSSISTSPSITLGQAKTKIVSGLPYGSHTVKIMINSSSGVTGITDFIIYRPKKPSIPEGCFEVADYCVVADYVIAPAEGVDRVSTGVIRAHNVRDLTYVGTWSALSMNVGNIIGGYQVSTTTLNSYVEFKFWGTGFDYRLNSEANQTQTLSVDDSTNLSSLTTQLIHSGATFTASAGTITGNGGPGGLLSVRGLALGWHKIKVTLTTASGGGLYPEAFDIITPISFVGQSVKSNTKYSPKKKVRIQKRKLIDYGFTSAGANPSLVFTGLTIGKTYRLSGSAGAGCIWNGSNININLHSGSNTEDLTLASFSGVGSNYLTFSAGVHYVFEAKSTHIMIARWNSGPQSSSGFGGILALEEIDDVDSFNLR